MLPKQDKKAISLIGKIIEIETQDLAKSGPAVGREEGGRVVFVPFAAPGERLRVRITREEKRFWEAEIVEILKPSPERQTPPCAIFGQCGGCQWQHLPYALQWKTKVQGLKESLKRVGMEGVTLEEKPADKIWSYRNRIQLKGENDKIGFFKRETHDIITMDRCEISQEPINQALPKLKESAAHRRGKYHLEVAVQGEKVSSAFYQKESPFGFQQVHPEQNEVLKQWIFEALKSTEARVLYDLFGGTGNLSLPLTSLFPEIHCVDVKQDLPSIEPRILWHESDVKQWLTQQRKRSPGKAAAILDPPRAGMGRDLPFYSQALMKLGVHELIAVGCDGESWARDLSRWVKEGWRLDRAAAIDFFPQTVHVEAVALFKR